METQDSDRLKWPAKNRPCSYGSRLQSNSDGFLGSALYLYIVHCLEVEAPLVQKNWFRLHAPHNIKLIARASRSHVFGLVRASSAFPVMPWSYFKGLNCCFFHSEMEGVMLEKIAATFAKTKTTDFVAPIGVGGESCRERLVNVVCWSFVTCVESFFRVYHFVSVSYCQVPFLNFQVKLVGKSELKSSATN